jgi:predicted RNA binding protein YcfA (HicA-like mRNA interferase family)
VDRRELRRRLAQRPNAVRFEELRRYLELCGFRLQRVKGSHHIFRRGPQGIVIPYRRPHVLSNYVREALAETREEGDDD